MFDSMATVALSDGFWTYLFLMCRALYAPLRLLRLADQQIPAMDKLHYFICQADRMMPKHLVEVEHNASKIPPSIKEIVSQTAKDAEEPDELSSEDDESDADDDVSNESDGRDGDESDDDEFDVSAQATVLSFFWNEMI